MKKMRIAALLLAFTMGASSHASHATWYDNCKEWYGDEFTKNFSQEETNQFERDRNDFLSTFTTLDDMDVFLEKHKKFFGPILHNNKRSSIICFFDKVIEKLEEKKISHMDFVLHSFRFCDNLVREPLVASKQDINEQDVNEQVTGRLWSPIWLEITERYGDYSDSPFIKVLEELFGKPKAWFEQKPHAARFVDYFTAISCKELFFNLFYLYLSSDDIVSFKTQLWWMHLLRAIVTVYLEKDSEKDTQLRCWKRLTPIMEKAGINYNIGKEDEKIFILIGGLRNLFQNAPQTVAVDNYQFLKCLFENKTTDFVSEQLQDMVRVLCAVRTLNGEEFRDLLMSLFQNASKVDPLIARSLVQTLLIEAKRAGVHTPAVLIANDLIQKKRDLSEISQHIAPRMTYDSFMNVFTIQGEISSLDRELLDERMRIMSENVELRGQKPENLIQLIIAVVKQYEREPKPLDPITTKGVIETLIHRALQPNTLTEPLNAAHTDHIIQIIEKSDIDKNNRNEKNNHVERILNRLREIFEQASVISVKNHEKREESNEEEKKSSEIAGGNQFFLSEQQSQREQQQDVLQGRQDEELKGNEGQQQTVTINGGGDSKQMLDTDKDDLQSQPNKNPRKSE